MTHACPAVTRAPQNAGEHMRRVLSTLWTVAVGFAFANLCLYIAFYRNLIAGLNRDLVYARFVVGSPRLRIASFSPTGVDLAQLPSPPHSKRRGAHQCRRAEVRGGAEFRDGHVGRVRQL